MIAPQLTAFPGGGVKLMDVPLTSAKVNSIEQKPNNGFLSRVN